jgi:hypothetical protein
MPDADLPGPVGTALAEQLELCREGGGTPHADKALQRADLNGDGTADFVLYVGWIECENAWSIYGDRAKAVRVFIAGDRGSASEAFADTVYDTRIETTDGAARLWLTVSGEACGRPPAPSFAEESFCERPLVWDAGAARLEYDSLDNVRMIE